MFQSCAGRSARVRAATNPAYGCPTLPRSTRERACLCAWKRNIAAECRSCVYPTIQGAHHAPVLTFASRRPALMPSGEVPRDDTSRSAIVSAAALTPAAAAAGPPVAPLQRCLGACKSLWPAGRPPQACTLWPGHTPGWRHAREREFVAVGACVCGCMCGWEQRMRA